MKWVYVASLLTLAAACGSRTSLDEEARPSPSSTADSGAMDISIDAAFEDTAVDDISSDSSDVSSRVDSGIVDKMGDEDRSTSTDVVRDVVDSGALRDTRNDGDTRVTDGARDTPGVDVSDGRSDVVPNDVRGADAVIDTKSSDADVSTDADASSDAGAVSDADASTDANADAIDGATAICATPPPADQVLQLATGGGRSCAVLVDGTLKCWGNAGAFLGLGTTTTRGTQPNEMGANLPPVDLGTGRHAVTVSLGYMHTCALLDDSSVKCWGGNYWGQLGLGHTSDVGIGPNQMGDHLPAVDLGSGRTAVAVSAGYGISCAVLDDGSVKCWGANDSGGLGLGDTTRRGDKPGQMGDQLPAIDLGPGRKAIAVSAGSASDTFYQHTCALLDDHSVKCWGANVGGELGLGDTANRGNVAGQMGSNLPAIDLGSGRSALSVSAGYAFTCALLDDHSVKCWGSSDSAGLGTTDIHGDQPNEMGNQLPAVDLGTGQTALTVSAGYSSACAVLTGGNLKCWGSNYVGQLGLGDGVSRGTVPGQMGDHLPFVDLGACKTSAVALGNGQSAGAVNACAILSNATVKCWGAGGQLGLGDTNTRGDQPGQMGASLPWVRLFSDDW